MMAVLRSRLGFGAPPFFLLYDSSSGSDRLDLYVTGVLHLVAGYTTPVLHSTLSVSDPFFLTVNPGKYG